MVETESWNFHYGSIGLPTTPREVSDYLLTLKEISWIVGHILINDCFYLIILLVGRHKTKDISILLYLY